MLPRERAAQGEVKPKLAQIARVLLADRPTLDEVHQHQQLASEFASATDSELSRSRWEPASSPRWEARLEDATTNNKAYAGVRSERNQKKDDAISTAQ